MLLQKISWSTILKNLAWLLEELDEEVKLSVFLKE